MNISRLLKQFSFGQTVYDDQFYDKLLGVYIAY